MDLAKNEPDEREQAVFEIKKNLGHINLNSLIQILKERYDNPDQYLIIEGLMDGKND